MWVDANAAIPSDTLPSAADHGRASEALVLFVGGGCRPGAEEQARLAREGARSMWIADALQARQAARFARFDAAVVDAATLGHPFGESLLELRRSLDCPTVLLAEARVADDPGTDASIDVDEIVALELGADVFLRHPVTSRRLSAHVGALLRRGRSLPREGTAAMRTERPATEGGGWVDCDANRLSAPGLEVDLTATQAALLQCLLEARGRMVPRAQLAGALPAHKSLQVRSLDVYVHRLRRRLAEAGAQGWYVEAVRGRGYRLTVAARTPVAPPLRAVA